MQSAYHEREFVSKLEELYPLETNIFQLPVTGFPPLSTHERMQSYDHIKPYLWSNHLNWSWPSFSQRHRSWQDNISTLDNKSLLRSLALSGFGLIWVDRYAYKDNGDTLIRGLVDSGAKEVLSDESTRYAVLDIDQVTRELRSSLGNVAFQNESDAIINSVLVKWEKGFYPVEKRADDTKFRWSKANSRVAINNPSDQPRNIIFSFEIQSQASGTVTVSGSQTSKDIISSSSSTSVNFEFAIEPMTTEKINFSTDIDKVDAPGDPREMYFAVINPTVASAPR
jgi:phosphoglycerol transferase